MVHRPTGIAVLLVLVLGAAVATASAASKPWFCHDLDCPDFKVVDQNDDYEVREYTKGASLIDLSSRVGDG